MAGQALLLMVLIPATLVVGLVVLTDRVLGRTRPVTMDDRFPALRGAWGITERSRAIGIAAGLLVGVACLALGPRAYWLTFVLAPAGAALACISGLLAGQLLVGRRLAGEAAGLEVRTIGRYASAPLRFVAALGTTLAAAALAAGSWYGTDGRFFTYRGTVRLDGVVTECTASSSAFLGSYYAAPLAVLLAAVGVAGLVALRAVVTRPRNGAEPAIVEADDETRRRAATSVLAAMGVAMWGTLVLALSSYWAATRTAGANEAMPGGCGRHLGWIPVALGWGALAAAGVLLWCLARLVHPSSRRIVDADGAVGERVSA